MMINGLSNKEIGPDDRYLVLANGDMGGVILMSAHASADDAMHEAMSMSFGPWMIVRIVDTSELSTN